MEKRFPINIIIIFSILLFCIFLIDNDFVILYYTNFELWLFVFIYKHFLKLYYMFIYMFL